MNTTSFNRRGFLKTSAAMAASLATVPAWATAPGYSSPKEELLVIGPLPGYSPQIGTLVSMLNYNRHTVLSTIKNLTMAELDHLHDAQANTIGALVLHLGAVDKFYQINTFEGRQEFNDAEQKIWNAAMNLGDEGRAKIKGHDVKYYVDMVTEVRDKTLAEFKKKDDKWLAAIDPIWSKEEQINTYWKWFHVCEHESNHRGQITWLKSRLPGAKPSRD